MMRYATPKCKVLGVFSAEEQEKLMKMGFVLDYELPKSKTVKKSRVFGSKKEARAAFRKTIEMLKQGHAECRREALITAINKTYEGMTPYEILRSFSLK